MEVSTPSRSSSSSGGACPADFTRPQDPESPSNFRAVKRIKGQQGHLPPSILKKGAGAPTERQTALAAIRTQLEEADRQAKVKREVLLSLAETIDKFVLSYKEPEYRTLGLNIGDKFIQFVNTSGYADSHGHDYYPIRVRSQPNTTTSSASKVTWAEIAATPKTSGASGEIPTVHAEKERSTASGRTTRSGSTTATRQREDRRILIALTPQALLKRAEPYAVRQAICSCVEGLNSVAAVPKIEPTRTGWAITPADPGTRDILTSPEAVQAICNTIGAISVKTPQKWYNYAVPGVPSTVTCFNGDIMETGGLIEDEVKTQTKSAPVSCRPSRFGANTRTGLTTWIISFLEPVRPFRLFNVSERSRLIEKKPAITRHDPGCQGYCHPPRCNRAPRCSKCAHKTAEHEGPAGANCSKPAQCANCHGPFPAGHDNCPAAPKRKNGKIAILTRKELAVVQRYGEHCYQETNAPKDSDTLTTESQPSPMPEAQLGATPAPKLRKRAADSRPTSGRVEKGWQTVPPGRPKRSTAYGGTHNVKEMFKQIKEHGLDRPLALAPEGMELESQETQSQ
jgi:hypothetical protein